MNLGTAAIVLNAAASAVCIWYAVRKRNTADRDSAYLLAFVWLAGLGLDLLHTAIVGAIPGPDVEPLLSLKTRIILATERAIYLAWPALILAWFRWTFRRARPWPVVLAWLAASALPVAVPALLRGARWFPYAGALHLAALAGEIAAFVPWVRLREAPRPWHVGGMVAASIAAFPAIPFFASSEARAGYLIWVLRGLVLGHLAIIAIVGGDLWNTPSDGSSRA